MSREARAARLRRLATSPAALSGEPVSVSADDLLALLDQSDNDNELEATAYSYIVERCEELERRTGVRVVSHSRPPHFTVAAALHQEFADRCAALRFAEAVAVALAKEGLLDGELAEFLRGTTGADT